MTYDNVKNGQQQKNGKLPSKLAEETPWNKLCVDLIGHYKIHINGKDPIILEDVAMTETINRCFEVTQSRVKKVTKIANLVETKWMVRY